MLFSVACFGVREPLIRVLLFLVRFGLLSGHLLEIAAHSFDYMFSLYFDYL